MGDMVARPGCGRSGPGVNRDRALATVKAYLTMLDEQGRAAEAVQTFIAGDFIQHSPQIPPGKAAFAKHLTDRTVAGRTEGRRSHTARVIADGDLVLLHRRVTTKADPRGVAHADLYRVRDGKIVDTGMSSAHPVVQRSGPFDGRQPLEPGDRGGPPDHRK
jgi:predicted SnoaL-like aldol condensation-catalyzing enzyme